MTKPTGRPRGRPRGSGTTTTAATTARRRLLPDDVPPSQSPEYQMMREIAHEYFLRIQTYVLTTCLSVGITRTVDIKYIKLMIAKKLMNEARKVGYLGAQDSHRKAVAAAASAHDDHDAEIDMEDGHDDE